MRPGAGLYTYISRYVYAGTLQRLSLAADCNVPQRPPALIRSFTSIQMVHIHKLQHTTLSHTHTALSHTHTTLSHSTLSHTHTKLLSHTTLSHAPLLYTTLSHINSFTHTHTALSHTHNSFTHHSFTHTHKNFCHIQLSHTHLFCTQLFHT